MLVRLSPHLSRQLANCVAPAPHFLLRWAFRSPCLPAFSPFGFSTAYHFSPSSLSLSPAFLLLVSFSLYHNGSTVKMGLDRSRSMMLLNQSCEQREGKMTEQNANDGSGYA